MTDRKGSFMGEGNSGAVGAAHSDTSSRGQPSIVASIPSDASQDEIEALEASIRAAKPTGNLSKEDTFKTWLG